MQGLKKRRRNTQFNKRVTVSDWVMQCSNHTDANNIQKRSIDDIYVYLTPLSTLVDKETPASVIERINTYLLVSGLKKGQ